MCRPLSPELGALSDLDMPGCTVLYGQHNASVHHIRGSVSVAALSNALWPQQNQAPRHAQDCLCLAAEHRHESAAQPDVFKGKHPQDALLRLLGFRFA